MVVIARKLILVFGGLMTLLVFLVAPSKAFENTGTRPNISNKELSYSEVSDIVVRTDNPLFENFIIENPIPKKEEVKPKKVTNLKLVSTHKTKIASRKAVKKLDARAIIKEVAVKNGCTKHEIDLLLKIAEDESSFRPNAVSPNGDCVGLFQLDHNKGKRSQRLDPYFNTKRAIKYMRARYGSIEEAYAFRVAHNWY